MHKFLISLVFFLFLTPYSFCQVILEKQNRVENIDPGFCSWCCLESLGKHHKIEALHDLTHKRYLEWLKEPSVWINSSQEPRNTGTSMSVSMKLKSLGVKFTYQDHYNYDKTLLKRAIKDKLGCSIVVKQWWKDKTIGHHSILLLDYNEKGIEFFDPNDIDHIYTATLGWFDQYWTGYTLILEK